MLNRFSASPLPLLTLALVTLTSCQTPPPASDDSNTAATSTSASVAPAAASAPSSDPLASLTFEGNQSALVELDRRITSAGRDRGQLSAIAEDLVALLNSSDASFAGRQAAAQRLGILLGGPLTPAVESSARATFAALLRNDLHVELARLALDTVPGAAVDTLLVNALAESNGRRRLSLIQSVAARHIDAAVPHLVPLLQDSDARLAAAATSALAEIGGRAAVEALRAANVADRTALVTAARRVPAAEAVALYSSLFNANEAAAVQSAALRSLIGADRAGAIRRIIEVLSQADWSMKEVALEATSAIPSAEIAPALASNLARFDAPTQIAVLAALARHGHASAVAAVSASCSHADAAVRAAALSALGFLPGNADTTRLLADKIATDSANARVARQSLARHDGPGVAATIQAGAQSGEPAQRAIYIEQLALRYMTESIPSLIAMRNDSAAPVRLAAVNALGDLGSASEQPVLLNWTISATDAAEQTRALRAFVTLTLRLTDPETRGQPLYTALETATPAVALRLLPALPRLGGAASASAAARLALRDDPALAEAAATTLARWPDRTALGPLLDLAEKAPDPTRRASATQNVLTWLERNRESWTSGLTEIASRLAGVAADDATRRRVLAILRRANEEDALAVLEMFKAHPALANDVSDTEASIRAQLGPAPSYRASAGNTNAVADRRRQTYWSVPANPEAWLEIDCKKPRPLHQLTLNQADRADDYPERYEVFVTDDLANPGTPRASGTGQPNVTVIDLPAGTLGRYIVIKHTAERKDTSWSISELYVD